MIPENIQSKVRLKDFNPATNFDRKASKLKVVSWYLFKMVFFLTAFPFPNALKKFLLKLFGAKVGTGVIIKPRVNIHMPWNLEIGDDVWIGEEVFILNFDKAVIGSNACLSQRAFLCGGNHNYLDPTMPYRNGPITIEDGAWVGASCFIGPNVTVGVDTIVTAGTIVVSSLPSNSIYKGNPATFVKNRWKN